METNNPKSLSLYVLRRLPATDDKQLNVQIEINENHEVFKGHFPEMPILPGVYLIQIIKDSLNTFLPDSYQLKSAGTVKYLKPVQPEKNNRLKMEITFGQISDDLTVSASSFMEDDTVHFKFKGEFIKL